MKRALVVLALVCCGGVSSHPEQSSGLSLDEMPKAIAQAWCEKMAGCCPMASDETGWLPSDFDPNLSICRQAQSSILSFGLAAAKLAMADGRLSYRGDRVAACLERFRAASCADARASLATEVLPCFVSFEGRVAQGGFCLDHHECAAGYCDDVLTGNGRCRPKRALGEACDENAWCTSDACIGDVCSTSEGARLCPQLPEY